MKVDNRSVGPYTIKLIKSTLWRDSKLSTLMVNTVFCLRYYVIPLGFTVYRHVQWSGGYLRTQQTLLAQSGGHGSCALIYATGLLFFHSDEALLVTSVLRRTSKAQRHIWIHSGSASYPS